MQRGLKKNLLAWVLLLAGPAAGDAAPARVVTGAEGLEECLAPVVIDRLDGEKRALPAGGFMVEAGPHSINGRVTLDTTKCRVTDAFPAVPRSADLEILFEPGKTYYVAYDRSAPLSREWRLVVWKVEAGP